MNGELGSRRRRWQLDAMGLWSKLIAASFVVLVGCCLLAVGPAQARNDQAREVAKWRVPLWKDTPGAAFAVLGSGEMYGGQWGVFASKGRGPASSPCLTVATIDYRGLYGNASGCGVPAPGAEVEAPPVKPLIGRTFQLPSGRVVEETFTAMSFRQDVSTVRVETGSGGIFIRPTRLLSIQKAVKAHLHQFRYVVLALRKNVCVNHIIGFDEVGNVLIDADGEECPLHQEPK